MIIRSPLQDLILRGDDPTGHGYYGARRKNKKHRGLDLVCDPGEEVTAPISGKVTKIGYPYSFALQFRYVEITGNVYRIRLMYVEPSSAIKVGDMVKIESVVGYTQDIAGFWDDGMLNHLHIEVYKHGLLTDPEPLLFPYCEPIL